MPEVGLITATYFLSLCVKLPVQLKSWEAMMSSTWVLVLILIGTGTTLVNSLDNADEEVLDEAEPSFPSEATTSDPQKCPKDVLIGGIADICKLTRHCAALAWREIRFR